MTLRDAIDQTAFAVGQAMLDLQFTDAEVDRAVEIMRNMNATEMHGSMMLLCREPEYSYPLFIAHDDVAGKQLLDRCKAERGTVATGTSLFEVMSSTWCRLWGELGEPRGPSGESY